MIVETLVSTLNEAHQPNFAPMGVTWGEDELIIRPFRSSHTYHNLLAGGCAVVNITDDVVAFVDSALGEAALPFFSATAIPGAVFQGACYWREVRAVASGGTQERGEFRCEVVHAGRQRDFIGFSRARAAVIEAAILATRLHLLEPAKVWAALDQYEAIVVKTGDPPERHAMESVREYARRWLNAAPR